VGHPAVVGAIELESGPDGSRSAADLRMPGDVSHHRRLTGEVFEGAIAGTDAVVPRWRRARLARELGIAIGPRGRHRAAHGATAGAFVLRRSGCSASLRSRGWPRRRPSRTRC
jgi:hypothetical protein